MSKNISKMPKSVEELMGIYSKYENTKKIGYKSSYTVDMLQNIAYDDNPVTPTHRKYYYSKYKSRQNWIYYLFLVFSIVFFTIHFTGYYIILNLLGTEVMEKSIIRTLFVIGISGYTIAFSILLARNLNKWNWKTTATLFPLTIGILFSVMIFIGLDQGIAEPLLRSLFSAAGIAFGPACLSVFLFYKFHHSITDYGGIHLFLGWIYRISETHGDLKVLISSFHNLMVDLDNWINETLRVLIKNKNEILEGFYFNLISDEEFLENISKKHRDLFHNIFTGLLVEDIFSSGAFSHIEEKDKNIPHLNQYDLEYLRNRLALTQMPKIINLIKTLSSKKVEILYYSGFEKLKKFKSKIISFTIFMFSTLVPLIFTLFT